jgi:hypothetical protein
MIAQAAVARNAKAAAAAFEMLTERQDSDLGPGPLHDRKTLEESIPRK